jgi:hypothetical protein
MSHSKQFDNVIIWGYPYGTHTQSYVWHGFYKAFKSLGIPVYWLANNWQYEKIAEKSIKTENSLFLCEKNDLSGMPLNSTSTYVVNNLGNRQETDISSKFLGKVKRVLDLRNHSLYYWDDRTNIYQINRPEVLKLEAGCMFEHSPDNIDKIYIAWATDLLPHEIDLEDCKLPRENESWYIGTIGGGMGGIDNCQTVEKPEHDNRKSLIEFRNACIKNGIEFKSNCPWRNPLSQEESMKLIKKSFLTLDSRHEEMKKWGYVPCRIMKNISYGQIGLCNSPAAFEFLEGEVIFRENGEELFYEGLRNQKNYEMIRSAMKLIRDKHTYINRCQSLLKALEF